jgi:hypothetical protein
MPKMANRVGAKNDVMKQKTQAYLFLRMFIGAIILFLVSCDGGGGDTKKDGPATAAPATVATPTPEPVVDTVVHELIPDTRGGQNTTYCNYEIDSRPVPPNNDGIVFGMFICINCNKQLMAPPCPNYTKISINKVEYKVKRNMVNGKDPGCTDCLVNPGAPGPQKKFKLK